MRTTTRFGKASIRVGREVVEVVEVAETCLFMLAWSLITVIRRRHEEAR